MIADDITIDGDQTLVADDEEGNRSPDLSRRPGIVFVNGQDAGQSFVLDRPHTVIGRASRCEIRVQEKDVSRRHALFDLSMNGVQIVDLRSRNGVFVNESRVQRCYIKHGDIIRLGGDLTLRFSWLSSTEIAFLEEMYDAAVFDPLTNAHNRRYFGNVLTRSAEQYVSGGRDMALLIVDLDNFKKLNDTFGHQVGDQALYHVASLIRSEMGEADTVCRFGGEEFAILLDRDDHAEALQVAEAIKNTVEDNPLVSGGVRIGMTVSIGVAMMREVNGDPDAVFALADARMYAAKEAGRNQIRFA